MTDHASRSSDVYYDPFDFQIDTDSTWPRSPELLRGELQGAGCSDAEIDKITWRNACRFFRFDPFVDVARRRATVGVLRATATDVDVRETTRDEYRRRWQERHAAA